MAKNKKKENGKMILYTIGLFLSVTVSLFMLVLSQTIADYYDNRDCILFAGGVIGGIFTSLFAILFK